LVHSSLTESVILKGYVEKKKQTYNGTANDKKQSNEQKANARDSSSLTSRFTYSGDDPDLVNHNKNLDKTKLRSQHDSKMERQRKKQKIKKVDITAKSKQFDLRRRAHVAILHSSPRMF
jgi:hypothetical protein